LTQVTVTSDRTQLIFLILKPNTMNHILKSLFYNTLFISSLFFLTSTSVLAQQQERIKIIFGTRVHPSDDGKGCEGDKGICLIVITKDLRIQGTDLGEAQVEEIDGHIRLSIQRDPDPVMDHENTFYLYSDKPLPPDVAMAFGYREITLKKGEYRIDKSDNPLGTIKIDANFEF
jgi:hypothetical protein